MRRNTIRKKSSRAWIIAVATAAAAALLAGCGGTGAEEPPVQILPDPEQQPPTMEPMVIQEDPLLPGREPPPAPIGPADDGRRVLELCNAGALTIRGDRELSQRLARDFTLELWIKPYDDRDQQLVRASNMVLAIRDGRLQARLAEETLAGPRVSTGQWHHVALQVDANTRQLYVDGRPATTSELERAWPRPRGPIVIGGDAERPFCGMVDIIRLVGHPLHDGEFVPEPELILLEGTIFAYDFDLQADQQARAVKDLSGNERDAALGGHAELVIGAPLDGLGQQSPEHLPDEPRIDP